MKIKGLRWWMVGLVSAGLIVNYLARNTLSVAAPTLMTDLHMTTEQYSHVVVAWQLCYAFMQPVAGYLLDAFGTKIGFGLFALAWSLACAAAAWSTGWQSLAFFRGLLGLTEAAGIPAGVKSTTEWFPAKERSVAIGWFNIGSSVGALLAPPLVVWALVHGQWQWAFLIVGALGIAWSAVWMLFMIGPACVGLVASPYMAIALLCIGGFAHQTLSGALYSITSDMFGKNEVATGMGGMAGYLGAAAFTALFGVLVTQVGYSPLFVMLAVFDILAAFVVCVLARSGEHRPAGARWTAMPAASNPTV